MLHRPFGAPRFCGEAPSALTFIMLDKLGFLWGLKVWRHLEWTSREWECWWYKLRTAFPVGGERENKDSDQSKLGFFLFVLFYFFSVQVSRASFFCLFNVCWYHILKEYFLVGKWSVKGVGSMYKASLKWLLEQEGTLSFPMKYISRSGKRTTCCQIEGGNVVTEESRQKGIRLLPIQLLCTIDYQIHPDFRDKKKWKCTPMSRWTTVIVPLKESSGESTSWVWLWSHFIYLFVCL